MSRICLSLCGVFMLLSGLILAQSDEPFAYEVHWSGDGRWLGVGSMDGIWIFDTHNPAVEPLRYGTGDEVYVAAFDPIRPHVAFASTEEEVIYVLDIETGDEILTISAPPEEDHRGDSFYNDLKYSDNGQYLAAVNITTLYIWDAVTGDKIAEVSTLNADPNYTLDSWLTTLDFGHNDTTVTVSDWQGYLLTYPIRQPRNPIIYVPCFKDESGYCLGIDQLELIPRSQQVVLLSYGRLLVYNQDRNTFSDLSPKSADSIANQRTRTFETDRVYGFDLNPDGTQVAIGMADFWFLYDLSERTILQSFTSASHRMEGDAWVYALTFNPQGDQIATLQTDGQFKVWDVATGEVAASWDVFTGGINQKWG